MPRRLIIVIFIVLILGIVGGTVVLVLQRFRDNSTLSPSTTTPGALQPAAPGNQPIANPTSDDDSDGLTNAEEVVWGANPAGRDTDGDGTPDGDEVTAGRNPTVAGPNDLLPEGFQLGQDIQPLPEAPLQANQFFDDTLSLTPDPKNFTEEYHRQTPEASRTAETMVAFAKTKPIITKLPTPKNTAIITTQRDSSLTVGHYLDVAGNLDNLINRTNMSQVFVDLFENNDASSAYGLAVATRAHQQALLALEVPPSAVQLQQLLLGYTEALIATYAQLASWPGDPVKAMVAVNQLDALDREYFPVIKAEVERLEQLQTSLE